MAYIANTAFESKVTNHEFDSTLNITGVFQASGANAICSAGFLCTKSTPLANDGYTSINNLNSYVMVEAESTATMNTPVYACNTFGVSEVTDPVTGNVYKIGANTLGLPAPAGVPTTYTQIKFDNVSIYRFGVGNVSGTVGTNDYFTIANGLLSPTDTQPTTSGSIYFTIVGSGTFTRGAQGAFGYYDVVANSVVA